MVGTVSGFTGLFTDIQIADFRYFFNLASCSPPQRLAGIFYDIKCINGLFFVYIRYQKSMKKVLLLP